MSLINTLENVLNDFKTFALDSKSTDIAIGLLLGAAVQPVAKSLVDDIIMPPLGLLGKNKLDLKDKYILLKKGKKGGLYKTRQQAEEDGAVIIGYGKLISTILNFTILSGSAYIFMKGIEKVRAARIDIPDGANLKFLRDNGVINQIKNIRMSGLGGMEPANAPVLTWGHPDKYDISQYNIPADKRALMYFRQKSPLNQKNTRRRLQIDRSPFYDIYNQYYAHKGNTGVYAQEKMPAWEDFVYDSRYWKTTLGGNFKKRGPVPLVHFPVAYREEVDGQYLYMPYGMQNYKSYNLSPDY